MRLFTYSYVSAFGVRRSAFLCEQTRKDVRKRKACKEHVTPPYVFNVNRLKPNSDRCDKSCKSLPICTVTTLHKVNRLFPDVESLVNKPQHYSEVFFVADSSSFIVKIRRERSCSNFIEDPFSDQSSTTCNQVSVRGSLLA